MLLVGSPFDDLLGADTGAAFLLDSQTGTELRRFENPTPEISDYYGKAVGGYGGQALIGSPGEVEGRAYLRDVVTGDVLTTYVGAQNGD